MPATAELAAPKARGAGQHPHIRNPAAMTPTRLPARPRPFRPSLEALEGRSLPSGTAWGSYARDPQHTGDSAVASQPLQVIRWQTPVDLQPQYSGNDLLIHYGSPLVTPANTVIVPVKTGASGGFELEGFNGATGARKWVVQTGYVLPPHDWTPSFSAVLTGDADPDRDDPGRLYFPGPGGTVYYMDHPDRVGATISGQLAFYGLANYQRHGDAFNGTAFINTPLTADASGNIYFGFQVTGANPLNLRGGLARISAAGRGSQVAADTASGDPSIDKVVHNSAPALSKDGRTVYVAVTTAGGTGFGTGYLLALNSATLARQAEVRLRDPKSGQLAWLAEAGTASPTVGPDGDVYFGVLEAPFPAHNDRGWLLHFSGDLRRAKTPGSFGWDDTASVVPASMVPGYRGTSRYLLMTKYNNYAGIGTGDGLNRLAILDPNAAQADPIGGASVMREVLTILGPTPDADHPGGVREWCINTAAVDPATRSVLANSEDGKLYRWDLTTNTFTESVTLTPGIGEAYTPTVIGADGTVYAVNNGTLFAVGRR
jgi:hypothetical protein